MSSSHSSSGIGDAIKKGVGMVHGTGEAIRGNFNAALDQAGGDRAGVEKNTAIASKGASEIEHGYQRTGHGAGVTPVDTEREHLNTSQTASTNYGPHSTNTANKLDPRFDSDLDHRANPNRSSAPAIILQNDGADSATTPFGRWTPPIAPDSCHEHDHDKCYSCHAQHIHRGSISGGTNLQAAQKLDPILSTEGGSTVPGSHCADTASQQSGQIPSQPNHKDIDDSNSGATVGI